MHLVSDYVILFTRGFFGQKDYTLWQE